MVIPAFIRYACQLDDMKNNICFKNNTEFCMPLGIHNSWISNLPLHAPAPVFLLYEIFFTEECH
jgi:hypothetical protein